ncbi:MAG: protein-disulfide isomerase [Myxococcota bacterium]|jgi:protein-disulfide isomerase
MGQASGSKKTYLGPMVIGVAVVGYLLGAGLRPGTAESKYYPPVAGPGYYEPLPAVGPADAPVVITMASDFRCPFCATKMTLMKRLMLEHRDDVRIVFKYLGAVRDPAGAGSGLSGPPTYARSEAAAIAALAANRQGKFWEYADRLFLNQKDRGSWNEEIFVSYAALLGLDLARFQADLLDPSLRSYVRKDQQAASVIGVSATPQLFVNGRLVSNSADAHALRGEIREAKDSVERLMAAGYSVTEARALDAAEQHVAGERFAQLYINNDVLDLRVDLR